MFELQGKRIWVLRDVQTSGEGFEGVVERVAGKWIYVKINDPAGVTQGIWLNTDLQREIAVLTD